MQRCLKNTKYCISLKRTNAMLHSLFNFGVIFPKNFNYTTVLQSMSKSSCKNLTIVEGFSEGCIIIYVDSDQMKTIENINELVLVTMSYFYLF